MDFQTVRGRKLSLEKALSVSLGNLRLSRGDSLSGSDRHAIKRTATKTLQNFLKKELGKTNTKTYDWYFYFEENRLFDIVHGRNYQDKSRYFIVDYEGPEVLIGTKYSFGSTVGQERIREVEPTHEQLSSVITNMPGLFSRMMEITVSKKEDKRLYAAYDNVDERKIFMVTIGFPMFVIGAVEALPLMMAYGQSATLPTLGQAFTVNSFRTGLFKGGSNLFGQLATNDFRFDNKIDYADPIISGFLGGYGSVLAESAFKLQYDDQGFQFGYEDHQNFIINTFTNSVGNVLGNKLSGFSKPLTDFSPNIGGFVSEFVGGTLIESGENVLGEELKLKVNLFKE